MSLNRAPAAVKVGHDGNPGSKSKACAWGGEAGCRGVRRRCHVFGLEMAQGGRRGAKAASALCPRSVAVRLHGRPWAFDGDQRGGDGRGGARHQSHDGGLDRAARLPLSPDHPDCRGRGGAAQRGGGASDAAVGPGRSGRDHGGGVAGQPVHGGGARRNQSGGRPAGPDRLGAVLRPGPAGGSASSDRRSAVLVLSAQRRDRDHRAATVGSAGPDHGDSAVP